MSYLLTDVTTLNLGFLASGRGSNMQAIIDACRDGRLNAKPTVIISNNASSGALERAQSAGIAGYHLSRKKHPDPCSLDLVILQTLQRHDVNLVILAGYMQKIGPKVLNSFKNRIINIHPSLLPKFGGRGMYGMKVHEAVLAAGEKETGATVHLVSEEYDEGVILAQRTLPVEQNDTPVTLAVRVLEVEHNLYVETLRKIISGEIGLPDKAIQL
ncbi:MAG: phosphoribosylglycinamide formyltransferase [Gammaproteobacteria bacterium]|nr:phosphoribosylglycinamide formyltransferase [Gammaproteobacteria bacterium]